MRISIAGIRVDSFTMAEALAKIEDLVRGRKPSYVVTPNADVVVTLHRDAEFRRIYEGAALVLPDGMTLIWAGLFLGTPFKEKVSGSDLFVEACRRAAEKGWRVFFFGARPGVAKKAAQTLSEMMPGLNVTGTYSPSFGFEKSEEENKRIIEMIRQSKPDIVFVGLGSPKQEKWMDRYKDIIGAPVYVSVGISFDYVAGTVKRAPRWMQRAGLEWSWRLLMEPKRLWKRYLVQDPMFFWLVLKKKWAQKS